MEEANPLTAVVEGVKQTPSNLSGSLSLDNTSLLSLVKTPINIQNLKRELVDYGDSVNDFIDPNLCSVEYTSFDAAVHIIQDLDQGCLFFQLV